MLFRSIQEAHFYHHRVLLLHEAHFSKCWDLLLHEAHFYQCSDLLLHEAHFYQCWDLLLHEAHFYQCWDLLLHEAHFYQHWVLLLHKAQFNKYSGLIVFSGHGKIAPAYDVTTNFSSFAKMEKIFPSMEYRNKFFQLPEDGKILPQYGIILIGTSFQTLHAYTT